MAAGKRPSLIFDYDGTIHDTLRIYEPAVEQAFQWLRRQGYAVPEASGKKITSWLGMNTRDMWNSFLPDLPGEIKGQAASLVGEAMKQAVQEGRAAWYPGMPEILGQLKEKGYSMAILSNCQASYAEIHWDAFRMERWFDFFFDCESFQSAPKSEIILHVTDRFPPPYVVIGDRYSDLEAAKSSGSPFIGCVYGFGSPEELRGAQRLAQTPEDLLNYL